MRRRRSSAARPRDCGRSLEHVFWNVISEGTDMRRYQRVLVIALAAVIVAAGLSAGLVKAYAQGESALAPVTPAELLTRMVDSGSTPTAVSGDISITNNLLGTFPAEFSLGGGGPAALVQSGSGRMWVRGRQGPLGSPGNVQRHRALLRRREGHPLRFDSEHADRLLAARPGRDEGGRGGGRG